MKYDEVKKTEHDNFVQYKGVTCKDCKTSISVRVYFYGDKPSLKRWTKTTCRCKCFAGILYSNGIVKKYREGGMKEEELFDSR